MLTRLVSAVLRPLAWSFSFLAGFVLVGCANLSTPKYPSAPMSVATADYNYIVGPDDNLNIIVWRNPELSMAVPVRPDGKVTTPLVDEPIPQGKTSSQIACEVEQALAKFARPNRHRAGYRFRRPIQRANSGGGQGGQAAGLNEAILDQGWFEFRRQLEYKLGWNGGALALVAVPPHNMSRTCPCCGHIAKENRLTQAKFLCVDCGWKQEPTEATIGEVCHA